MRFRKDQFDYDSSKNSYVQEVSMLRVRVPSPMITIDGFTFRQTKVDRTPDGEDIAGWRYAGPKGATALLIND